MAYVTLKNALLAVNTCLRQYLGATPSLSAVSCSWQSLLLQIQAGPLAHRVSGAMNHSLTSLPLSQECWQCQIGQWCLNQCFGKPASPLCPSPVKQSWSLQLCCLSAGQELKASVAVAGVLSAVWASTHWVRLISFLEPQTVTLPQAPHSWVTRRIVYRSKTGYKTGINAKYIFAEERTEAENESVPFWWGILAILCPSHTLWACQLR